MKYLVVCSTNPVVDNVKHWLVKDSSGSDKGDKTNHGQTSVNDFSFFGKSEFGGWQVTERLGFTLNHLVVGRVVGVHQKGITEWKRADGSHKRNTEEVSIGNQDQGTFGRDSVLSGDGGKGSPFLQVKNSFGKKSVSLGVGCAADEEPSEHGVTSIPLFGMYRRSPSPLGKGCEVLGPLLLGILVNFGVNEIQGAV